MINQIKEELKNNKDEKYAKFSSSLLPNISNIIGVRLPILKKMANKIAKENFDNFINYNDDEFFELTMLEGMVIGNLKLNYDEKIKYIEDFIPKINCWSVCDSFCSGLKIFKTNKEKTKTFIEKYFNSNKEYEIRFAYVVLLNYFTDDFKYTIDKILKFNSDLYYAKMAAAWCLSYCFINHFEQTILYIKNNKINHWVLKKGITKSIESLKLTQEQKNVLKILRKTL